MVNVGIQNSSNTKTSSHTGIIYMSGGTLGISGGIFSGNKGGAFGSVLGLSAGTVTISGGASFTNNSAVNGGVINDDASVTINGATFSHNMASADGGAVRDSIAKTLILGGEAGVINSFDENYAGARGGAIVTTGNGSAKATLTFNAGTHNFGATAKNYQGATVSFNETNHTTSGSGGTLNDIYSEGTNITINSGAIVNIHSGLQTVNGTGGTVAINVNSGGTLDLKQGSVNNLSGGLITNAGTLYKHQPPH